MHTYADYEWHTQMRIHFTHQASQSTAASQRNQPWRIKRSVQRLHPRLHPEPKGLSPNRCTMLPCRLRPNRLRRRGVSPRRDPRRRMLLLPCRHHRRRRLLPCRHHWRRRLLPCRHHRRRRLLPCRHHRRRQLLPCRHHPRRPRCRPRARCLLTWSGGQEQPGSQKGHSLSDMTTRGSAGASAEPCSA